MHIEPGVYIWRWIMAWESHILEKTRWKIAELEDGIQDKVTLFAVTRNDYFWCRGCPHIHLSPKFSPGKSRCWTNSVVCLFIHSIRGCTLAEPQQLHILITIAIDHRISGNSFGDMAAKKMHRWWDELRAPIAGEGIPITDCTHYTWAYE